MNWTNRSTLTALTLLFVLAVGSVTLAAEPTTFRSSSYWNTPVNASGPAPVHAKSALWIADSQKTANTQNYLQLTTGSFAQPFYKSTCDDKVYRINPTLYGDTYSVHIPASARAMDSSDAAIAIFDNCSGQVVGMWRAAFNGTTWTSGSLDHYALNSEGLDKKVATSDSITNDSHRGIPASIRGIQFDEAVAGAIDHRMECFWHATAPSTPEAGDGSAYWPMTGAEQGKGGIVPEGVVIRIKASVNLAKYPLSPAAQAVAKSLQTYGCTVGDNSGSGNRLKMQGNANWSGRLTADSLKSLPWSLWEFVKGGYDPRSGTVR